MDLREISFILQNSGIKGVPQSDQDSFRKYLQAVYGAAVITRVMMANSYIRFITDDQYISNEDYRKRKERDID